MTAPEMTVRAAEAAAAADVEIRDVVSLEEIDAAIAAMIATWGPHQLVPSELFRAFGDARDVVQGAWRGDEMIGFTLGFFGRDDDGWNLHSHMLAVNPDRRSRGVGYALKLAQAAATLQAGVTRVRWTFDPLLSRNAYFNLSKLGATADAFARDFYGAMPDDLNSGDRSDRLFVRWDLEETTDRPVYSEAQVVLERSDPRQESDTISEPDIPITIAPGRISLVPGVPVLIRIPRDYPALRVEYAEMADRWREDLAEAFERCFAAGLTVRLFTADSTYVLA